MGLGAFLIWLAAGWLVVKRMPAIKERALKLKRGVRILLATAMLFGGGAALLAGLMGIQSMNASSTLTTNQWVSVAFLGAVFVAAQTAACVMLYTVVEENVTLERQASSKRQDTSEER